MGDSKYRIFRPGDKGYNANKRYPWDGIYQSLGMKTPMLPFTVDGFYLLDRRFTPSMAIFRNCVINGQAGNRLREPLEPFVSARDAWMARERMHLSMADTDMVEIHALVLDPGLGMPKPDMLVFTKKEIANS